MAPGNNPESNPGRKNKKQFDYTHILDPLFNGVSSRPRNQAIVLAAVEIKFGRPPGKILKRFLSFYTGAVETRIGLSGLKVYLFRRF